MPSRKKTTLAKLGWVCGQIERVLAGQNITLADIPLTHDPSPSETPLERLQAFKAVLNQTLAEINQGVARTCATCQQPLADAALDEMPWASVCQACTA